MAVWWRSRSATTDPAISPMPPLAILSITNVETVKRERGSKITKMSPSRIPSGVNSPAVEQPTHSSSGRRLFNCSAKKTASIERSEKYTEANQFCGCSSFKSAAHIDATSPPLICSAMRINGPAPPTFATGPSATSRYTQIICMCDSIAHLAMPRASRATPGAAQPAPCRVTLLVR